MARIVVASTADADTDDIIAYLAAEAGRNTAARYIALFDALYDRLSIHPESCVKRPDLGPDARIGIVKPFVVIYDYRPASNTVTILRILHGHRDIKLGLISR